MLGIINKGIAKVFGTKAERDLKELVPYVEKINGEFNKLSGLSDDELRNRTTELKQVINGHLKKIDDELAALHQKIEDEPNLDIHEKESIFNKIDKLERRQKQKP